MSKLILLICSVFIIQVTNGQDYKDSIKNQFMYYNDLIVKKDFPASFEYINPGLFNLVPKEQLLQIMDQTFNNPDIEIKLAAPKILSIDDSLQIKQMSYVKLKYSGKLDMRFVAARDSTEMLNAFGAQFGKENVKYDPATQFYTIQLIKNVVANSKDGKNWTFVDVEEKQKEMLEKFIPKELL